MSEKVTSNEQKVTSNKQKLASNEPLASIKEYLKRKSQLRY